MEKLRITAGNASKIWEWFQERGGVCVWECLDISNPGASWATPLRTADGDNSGTPHWAASLARTITDPAEVIVDVPAEVKRFHVAVRPGSQGLSPKLTDGSTRRVRKAVEKAGDGAWYGFDYATQEAVVWRAGEGVPLTEFVGAIAAE